VAIEPVGLKVPAFAWVGTLEGSTGGEVGADVDPGAAAGTCADSPVLLTAVIQ
jgi:hypothetical protein